jgi:hypothetical protein
MRTIKRAVLTIRTIAHAVGNIGPDTINWTFGQWQADYQAVRELRAKRIAAR